MKKSLLVLLLVSSVFVQAQSLKEALYGGKLKNTSGTVIRKGDDLTSKTDTTQRTAAIEDSGKAAVEPPVANTSPQGSVKSADSAAVSTTDQKDNMATDATAPKASGASAATAVPKSNTVLLKAYMDSVVSSLKTEALSSKKIKRGDYYVLVSYTIDTTGQVSFGDVFLSPENSLLQQQIKDRLAADGPHLSPVLSGSGAPRKVNKKYNFTLSKE